ncbi:HD domain-containing phosphohydrolase [Cupriavidus sp. 30B13]|uniref:HD domain-containing phosphohydrolase n=1 Tax=Cupriavidus sp. 30B13 TaxID=3384241 RepID=UPI003B902CDE
MHAAAPARQPGSSSPHSIYITLLVLMAGMVLLLYGALTLYERHASERLMLAQAKTTFERVGREAVASAEAELRPARLTAALLAETPLLSAPDQATRLAQLPVLATALRHNPSLSAVYGGTGDGSFVLLRDLRTADPDVVPGAPAGAAFLLQSVDRAGGQPRGRFAFYDAGLRLLAARDEPDYRYDPRERPWFAAALATGAGGAVVQTGPYRFSTTRELGLTMASARGQAVAGVDVSLRDLSEMLVRQHITPSAELMIVNPQGAVLAYSRAGRAGGPDRQAEAGTVGVAALGVPVLSALWQRARQGRQADVAMLSVDEREWVARLEPLPSAAGAPLMLAIAAPRDELQADAIRSRKLSLLITAGIVLLMLPLVHWAASLIARPLEQLGRQAAAIRRFDFSLAGHPRSRIREIDRLATAMLGMKETLRRFLEISDAMSSERDFDTLLDRILTETISVSGASEGAIHLLAADGLTLEPAAIRVGDAPGDLSGMKEWSLNDPANPAAAMQAARDGRTVSIEASQDDPSLAATYSHLFARLQSPRFRVLALPLKNRQDEVVGTLSLVFLPETGMEDNLPSSRAAFVEALSGTAAVAIDNQLLSRGRKDLMESFIQMLAGAIDAKSAYTGGHCQRVPELTKMLARAACDADCGPYASYQLSEAQWEELHIAAWLHDCGKVTTPEFVVDKATKLETLYDRIHEIRMRFELLKRDAYVEQCEQALRARGADLAAIRAAAAPAQAVLDEEFAFVAACNQGGEFMAQEKIERLRAIGSRTWLRTLDDRLGISRDERRRKEAQPAPPLPADEPLLADKAEHVFARPERERLPAGNPWGFTVKPPEHLYDRGELHNLTIGRGTLTEEERYKINEHIVQTIKMLSALPFPRHLRNVPEIAGGHHEKMDGTGYPKGLTREQMSPAARMMAIADVFEALTADDRPYKKGKTLSEAMEIMVAMKNGHHLDPDLFDLFLRSGVYLDYARRFMRPEQIDEVDLEVCLA